MPKAHETSRPKTLGTSARKVQRQNLHGAPSLQAEPMTDTPPSLVLGATVAAGALGAAIQNGNGMLYGAAAEWLLLAVVAAVFGAFAPKAVGLARVCRALVPLALLGAFTYAFGMWPYARTALYVTPQSYLSQRVLAYALSAAAILCGASVFGMGPYRRLHLPLLLGVYALLGVWLVRASPAPVVDVVTLTNESLAALVRGHNPFAISFANIYSDASHYPPGLVKDGRVLFGYDYMPVNLLMAAPAYLLGDFRYSLVAANLVSAALLATLGPKGDRVAQGGHDMRIAFAALFLLTPRALLVLENGWTEPYAVLFLTATLWCGARRPAFVPYALGLLLASKQYVVLLMASAYHLPAIVRLGRDLGLHKAFWTRVMGTAACVTLPFVLWSPAAFWHSVIAVPLSHPFRPDALSFLAWYKQNYGVLWPTAFGFVALAVMSFVTWWRVPRSAAGFAYAFGANFLFFVAFNRQAFCNYYFLIIASFCAAAALGHNDVRASQPHSP